MKHSLELTDKHPSLEVNPLSSNGVERFMKTGRISKFKSMSILPAMSSLNSHSEIGDLDSTVARIRKVFEGPVPLLKRSDLYIKTPVSFSANPVDSSYLIQEEPNFTNPIIDTLVRELTSVLGEDSEDIYLFFERLSVELYEIDRSKSTQFLNLILELFNRISKDHHATFIEVMLRLKNSQADRFYPGSIRNELHERFQRSPESIGIVLDYVDFKGSSVATSQGTLEYLSDMINSKSASGTDNNYTKSIFDTMYAFRQTLKEKISNVDTNYFLYARAQEIVNHLGSQLKEKSTYPVAKGLVSRPRALFGGIMTMFKNKKVYFTRESDLVSSIQTRLDDLEVSRDDSRENFDEFFALRAQLEGLFSAELCDLEELKTIGLSEEENSDYAYLVSDYLRDFVESDFPFSISSLTIQEQIYFLNHLKTSTVKTAWVMKTFISQYGIPAMRSFLTLAESEGVTGEDIVNFGNTLGDSARDVFGRYCEILDAVNEIDVWLSSRVKVSPEEYIELKEQIKTSLMKNANQLLRSAIASGESEGIQKQLEACQAEARQEVAVLQAVGIDKLVSKPLEQTPAVKLSETDRARMRELVRDNYKNETPEFQALVAKSLEEHITDPNTNFYVLRNQNGLIISFNRFDKELDTETGELSRHYFGSFNADPIYFGVGSIMMERTIKDQLDKCPVLYAHCDPRAKISQKYIEDGFIGTQTVSPAGKFSFEIWRTKNSSEKLKTKQMTPEALVAMAGETVPADFDYFVREVEPNDQFLELEASFPFLLTRYFTVGGQTYAAFELNTELSRQFEIPPEKEQPVVPVQRAA